MSWPNVKARELMLKRGGSVDPSKFPNEIFDLLSIPAFDKNEIEVLSGAEIGSSKINVEPNDVLLSKIIPHIRRCWVVPKKNERRQIGSGEWIIFRDRRFNPDFLKHFLTSDMFHKQFMETVAGVGGSLVRARPAAVENIEIPLPPLPEQKRIAAILDKADAIRRKRQHAIKLSDDFLRAVFLEMFGDPVTNPKGWEVRNFGDLCKCSQGIQVDADLQLDFERDGYSRFLRIINYTQPSTPYKYIPTPESQKSHITPNDIVMVRYGATAGFVGRGVEGYLANNLFKITSSEIFDGDFLYFFLSGSYFQNILAEVKQGGAMPALSFGQLNEIKMYVPPIGLQRNFSAVMKNLSLMSARNKIALDIPLFESLSQQAFSDNL